MYSTIYLYETEPLVQKLEFFLPRIRKELNFYITQNINNISDRIDCAKFAQLQNAWQPIK